MKYKKVIAMLLIMAAVSTSLYGCQTPVEVPQLVEPLAQSESFRPVERRTIGKLRVEIGNVVPKEYCHSYKKITTVKNICVDVGQYVKAGDILAVADIEKLNEELADLQTQKELLIQQHEINAPVYGYTKEILELEKQGALNVSDFISDGKIATQLETEEENHIYDEKLYNYMLSKYDKKISDINKQISDGSLKAKADGYVTYIKDTSKGNTINIGEAVVIVADYEDLHIEVPSLTTANNKYKNFEVRYALIGGKEVPIEEDAYTSQELIYSRAQEAFPNIRYYPADSTALKIGETILLFFVQSNLKDVICVGTDSTNVDETGNYVYVKTADDSMEKRYVTLGSGDEYYIEVTSGLSEGEEVYYTQDSVAPVKYIEYVASKSKYVESLVAKQLKKAEINNTAYFAPTTGTVTEIYADTGAHVSKGDVIMVIDSGGGSAAIADADTDIKHLSIDTTKKLYDHDRNIWDLNEQIKKARKDCIDEKLCEPEYKRLTTIWEDQIKLEEIGKVYDQAEYESNYIQMNRRAERLKKDNDGTGKISIIAEDDGIVAKMYVHKGTVIDDKGNNRLLATLTKEAGGKAQISLPKDEPVTALGAKIKISVDKGDNTTEEHEAKCISNAWNQKSYAYTEDGKACVAKVVTDDNKDMSVISLEEPDLLDNVNIKNCSVSVEKINADGLIVLPGAIVHKEESKKSTLVKYFVWKIQNGKAVKQYIIPGADYKVGDYNNVVVMSGVEEGDILAKE